MSAPNENSYGDLEGVGALTPKFSGAASDFAETTRPTDDFVVKWIDQISSLVNSILARAGFTTPIDQVNAVDVTRQCAFFVEQEVASIVEGLNGFGRFGPTAKKGGAKGRFALLVEDVEAFIEANAIGFERLGATRAEGQASGIAFRDTDESGTEISPIFQREGFGNIFQNWDT